MNSFNAYGQTSKSFGGHTPVWLGTVRPIPKGAVLKAAAEDVEYPFLLKAGTPVIYLAGTNEFLPWTGDNGTPNGYLYNDIFVEKQADDPYNYFATGAIVMHHAEGLLIDRTDFAEYAVELQAAIPGVLLVTDSYAAANGEGVSPS